MAAENPASATRLTVLASGLHQLGATCARVGAQLAADATPSVVGPGWALSAAITGTAAAAAGQDVGAIGKHIVTRGANYAEAARTFTANDQHNAERLRRLVH